PELVARTHEERQEGVPVAARSVAQAGALGDRARGPRQLRSANCQFLVEESAERRDHPRRAVTPLQADGAVLEMGPPASAGQFASPSSTTAYRRAVSPAPSRSPSSSTQPAKPCAAPRRISTLPYRCCVQSPVSGSRAASNRSAESTRALHRELVGD